MATAATPQKSQSERGRRRVLLLAGTAFLAAAGVYGWRWLQPRPVDAVGTIVSVDLPQRTGVLRVIHPKTGESFEISGEIAEDCAITRNDSPVNQSALQPGMKVRASGLLYRSGWVVANALCIEGHTDGRGAAMRSYDSRSTSSP